MGFVRSRGMLGGNKFCVLSYFCFFNWEMVGVFFFITIEVSSKGGFVLGYVWGESVVRVCFLSFEG